MSQPTWRDEAKVADYDACIFPGGCWNPDALRADDLRKLLDGAKRDAVARRENQRRDHRRLAQLWREERRDARPLERPGLALFLPRRRLRQKGRT